MPATSRRATARPRARWPGPGRCPRWSEHARGRTTGGTGLGLAIALEDARLHGGWLQAWGTPGGGAQFRLTLPRRAGDPLTHSPLPLVPEDIREGVT